MRHPVNLHVYEWAAASIKALSVLFITALSILYYLRLSLTFFLPSVILSATFLHPHLVSPTLPNILFTIRNLISCISAPSPRKFPNNLPPHNPFATRKGARATCRITYLDLQLHSKIQCIFKAPSQVELVFFTSLLFSCSLPCSARGGHSTRARLVPLRSTKTSLTRTPGSTKDGRAYLPLRLFLAGIPPVDYSNGFRS